MSNNESKWDRPEYTARQVRAIASGRLDPRKLNAQLREAGKGAWY